MKYITISFACLAALAISGCAGAIDHQSQAGNDHSQAPIGEQLHQRRETVAYNWQRYGIEVSFYRQAHESHWTMAVRDSHRVIDQALAAGEEKIWAISDSKCSTQDCLRIIDQSLRDFHAEKPNARLESVDIEMHIIKDLWGEILVGLHQGMASLGGEKSQDLFDIPPAVGIEVENVVNASATTVAIKRLLREHGINVGAIGISEYLLFKDSLSGRKWSDIATLPGIGIMAPGTIEFGVVESRAGSTSEPGVKRTALLQSPQP